MTARGASLRLGRGDSGAGSADSALAGETGAEVQDDAARHSFGIIQKPVTGRQLGVALDGGGARPEEVVEVDDAMRPLRLGQGVEHERSVADRFVFDRPPQKEWQEWIIHVLVMLQATSMDAALFEDGMQQEIGGIREWSKQTRDGRSGASK